MTPRQHVTYGINVTCDLWHHEHMQLMTLRPLLACDTKQHVTYDINTTWDL